MNALARLIDAHKGAFEYDWRTRFRLPLRVVGTSEMTWGEALRQTQILCNDPSSQVFAAQAGWEFPVSREWIVLAQHRDEWAYSRAGRKAEPLNRPWGGRTVTRVGKGHLSPDEFRALVASVRDDATDGPLGLGASA